VADILYIEDNPHHCELMQQHLPQHNCVCVQRAADAVRVLESRAFDLVIADVALPDSAGESTLQTLQIFAPRLLAVSSFVRDIQVSVPFQSKEDFKAIAGKAIEMLNANPGNLIEGKPS